MKREGEGRKGMKRVGCMVEGKWLGVQTWMSVCGGGGRTVQCVWREGGGGGTVHGGSVEKKEEGRSWL